MADVIQFDQIRRARRLFGILLNRMGLDSFLQGGDEPRIDPARFEETLSLCCDWIERRTGNSVENATRNVIQRQIRRELIQHIAEGMVRAGF